MSEKKCIVLEYLYDVMDPKMPPVVKVCGKVKLVSEKNMDSAMFELTEKTACRRADYFNSKSIDPAIREARAFRADENGDDTMPYAHVVRLWDGDDYRLVAGYLPLAYTDADIDGEEDELLAELNRRIGDKFKGEQAVWERKLHTMPLDEVLHSHCWEQTVRQDIMCLQENEEFDCETCLRLLYTPDALAGFTAYVLNTDHSSENECLLGNMFSFARYGKEGERIHDEANPV